MTSKWPCTDEADFCGEWQDGKLLPEQHERQELIRQFALAIVASDTEGDSMVHRVWQRAAEFADYKGQT